MCVVGERTSRDDYEAIKLEEQKKYPEAIAKLENYLKDHPWNEGKCGCVYPGCTTRSASREEALRCTGESLKWQTAVDGCIEYPGVECFGFEKVHDSSSGG